VGLAISETFAGRVPDSRRRRVAVERGCDRWEWVVAEVHENESGFASGPADVVLEPCLSELAVAAELAFVSPSPLPIFSAPPDLLSVVCLTAAATSVLPLLSFVIRPAVFVDVPSPWQPDAGAHLPMPSPEAQAGCTGSHRQSRRPHLATIVLA